MKKLVVLFAVGFLTAGAAMAQKKQVFKFDSFENVDLDGNIRIFLEQGREAEVEIEAKRESHLDEYKVEVRGNTLYVQHYEPDRFRSAPKIHVYLKHPGIREMDVDGLIYIYSNDTVESESLRIKGDGLIRGDIVVNVGYLRVALDGLCTMTISGQADETDLRLDGMGKIRAQDLDTRVISKSADGLASIRVGGR
ncbi:GIN domain-containing protein [Poritiphilus flavus]|uniref:Putative auto-transporter adhesin head GIN domain-containing protein n=1 Tax=Poritiphilus flavus TaxID=2697053 RepID=A0A6L9EGA1_9FLAO|nr:DUF2807 domain-containing protein [Poritiphilus flavus]NAS13672.1 hypothetical protein [Poritiphilus flavus]